MRGPLDRAREMQELLQRFREASARRRRSRRLVLISVAVAFCACLLAIILALTWPGPDQVAVVDPTTAGVATPITVTTSSIATTTTTTTAPAVDVVVTPATTTTTTTTRPQTAVAASRDGLVVVIDPGHQDRANAEQEPIGPGSTQTKAKVSGGTRSVNTGRPESELVLEVALKLRDSLGARGIKVVMTRTTQEVNISNIERAQLANQAPADLFVRVHADGAADSSIHGILMLYPATIAGWTDDIAAESRRAAQIALDALLAATGAKNRGLVARSDLTGFNWSDVPVVLAEIGLMTNATEDALLATDEYQGKVVQGLTDAILEYLDVR